MESTVHSEAVLTGFDDQDRIETRSRQHVAGSGARFKTNPGRRLSIRLTVTMSLRNDHQYSDIVLMLPSGQDPRHDVPVHIGQAIAAALELVGQSLMVDAKQMHDRGM